jgi:hypothetical protein
VFPRSLQPTTRSPVTSHNPPTCGQSTSVSQQLQPPQVTSSSLHNPVRGMPSHSGVHPSEHQRPVIRPPPRTIPSSPRDRSPSPKEAELSPLPQLLQSRTNRRRPWTSSDNPERFYFQAVPFSCCRDIPACRADQLDSLQLSPSSVIPISSPTAVPGP